LHVIKFCSSLVWPFTYNRSMTKFCYWRTHGRSLYALV